MEDMRLALTEQEETQEQMEQALEEKLDLIEKLTSGKTQDLKLPRTICNIYSKYTGRLVIE